MTKRVAKYTVYVEEEYNDGENMDISDALEAIPGYVEHQWDDWV